MNSENRELTVVTAAMLTFKMQAADWKDLPPRTPYHVGGYPEVQGRAIAVWKAEPGNGTPSKLVAEFADVHAVYWSDEVTLVVEEEEDE